ncbi:MAG: twin-arginine translocase subunit TatC [Planctomycetota bacterium]
MADTATRSKPSAGPKLARAKDDLFDNSTMTFGEHLEELRQCLVKAIIGLGVGLALGLFVANRVVLYVAEPLKDAIQKFNAERDLALLGYTDLEDPDVKALMPLLSDRSLKFQVIYEIPDELQNLDLKAIEQSTNVEGEAVDRVKPREMAEILKAVPDPSQLTPKVQLLRDPRGLSSFKVEESFMIWVKAGLIVGAVISSPWVFYHLWQFVAAGLHRHERKYVYIYLPVSVTLFVAGVVLAFFLVLHYVLNFLLAFNGSMDVAVEPRLTYYINFVLLLPLGFGIAFQLPLVMLFLQRIGLIETEMYIDSWRLAVLVIFVLSMILTPADVTSMVALAVPLMVLYFLGILMCKFIPRGPGLGSAAYDPA